MSVHGSLSRSLFSVDDVLLALSSMGELSEVLSLIFSNSAWWRAFLSTDGRDTFHYQILSKCDTGSLFNLDEMGSADDETLMFLFSRWTRKTRLWLPLYILIARQRDSITNRSNQSEAKQAHRSQSSFARAQSVLEIEISLWQKSVFLRLSHLFHRVRKTTTTTNGSIRSTILSKIMLPARCHL